MKRIIKTRDDLLKIIRMYYCGFTMLEISKRYNVSVNEVSALIDELHEKGYLVMNRHVNWTIDEIDRIKSLYKAGVPLCDIALSVNRSKDAVKTKLLHIRRVEQIATVKK